MASDPPGTIFFDEAKGHSEVINHSKDAIFVNGLQCTYRQPDALVLKPHSVLEIAGVVLVYDRL